MLKDIKKKFTTKAVLAFILVVALLIIVADQHNKKSALQAEVDGLIDITATIENQNIANITALENIIASYEEEVAALQGRVVEADGERIKAEIERARVINQLEAVGLELDANITALNDALENPNCPVEPTTATE
jgi:hypothetical protein